jgi:hypothetical protein
MASAKKTLAELRARHDRNVVIPNRIREAIEILKKSGDHYAYEGDFMKLVKPAISTTDIGKFREQFTDYWVDLPIVPGTTSGNYKRAWFATPALKKEWEDG